MLTERICSALNDACTLYVPLVVHGRRISPERSAGSATTFRPLLHRSRVSSTHRLQDLLDEDR